MPIANIRINRHVRLLVFTRKAFALRYFVLWAFYLFLFFGFSLSIADAATPLVQMEKQLAIEKKKAAERNQSLKKLTEQERKINAGLVATEARILELEKGIEFQQAKLSELAKTDDSARQEYETLLAEQAKTEAAQAETLKLLWDISSKRMAAGNRDLSDWAELDREYAWSKELYQALEKYRKILDEQEGKLTKVTGRRDKISQDMQKRLKAVNEEKTRLLKNRLSYDRQLAELRKKKVDTEAELTEILQLIGSLNFELSQRTGDNIEKLKGKLPWPATGVLNRHYAPQAEPASSGIGIATADRAEVRAVAGGKIVHNDVLRGFGTVLIVQHGEDYYSLYAFLGNSPLKVGQDVSARQKVGSVGYYPAVKGPGLYFELRFKKKPINPEQWLTS